MEKINTFILNTENNTKDFAVIKYDTTNNIVELISEKFHLIQQGIDLLDSFTQIRKILEEEKYIILVNGSRIDVNASGLLRSSTNGISTYLLSQNFEKNKEVLNIFNFNDENIGTIEEQIIYFKKWRKEYVKFINKKDE